jgi:hypothetical protein
MSDHRPYRRRSSPEDVGLRTSELGRPLDLGPGDDRYVREVLKLGGFHYVTKLPDGRYVEVRP